jgi:uncharacterized protein (TIGR03118 family)
MDATMHAPRPHNFAGFLLAVLMLAACGGDDAPPAPPAPPVAPPVAPSALSYTSPTDATVGVAVSLLPTVTGTVTSYGVSPALPAGLALSTATGAITGTPTALHDTATYTITATNSAGSTTFALALKVGAPAPSAYSQSNLVSNGAVAGTRVDTRLVNPWGIALSATSPAWVTNNVSQTSTLYDGTGTVLATVVTIPPGTNGAASPTGIVANSTAAFTVTKAGVTGPARFIFSGEGGTISGWSPTVDAANAITVYDDGAGGAQYMGLAIAVNGTADTLYATDFRNGKVDVFDSGFAKLTPAGGFTDPNLPAGYAPYGIQAVTLGTTAVLVVTYANRDAAGNEAIGAGLGIVNVFDLDGGLLRRLVDAGGRLNAPWGVALAPAAFGSLGNMLLVGNFGDGVINAFDPNTGVFAGAVSDAAGTPLANAGLWGLVFGNGAQNQPVSTLYLAAGISGETGGLYARIDAGATAPDVTAPTVTLTTPAAGPVSGTVTLTADAADDVGVASVNFIVRIGTTSTTVGNDSTAPFTFDLDTTTLANGAATLTAQALDATGNATTSAAVTVTVGNVAVPTLAQLQTDIFTPRCSGCHNGAGGVLPGVMNLSSAAASFAALVNVDSLEVGALKRVAPGNPAGSYLVQKLEGTQAMGQRMPLGGPFLDAADVARVEAWIQAGAQP